MAWNLTQVTNNPATDSQASWLPEGDKLAFLSDRDNKHLMLWTISLATGKEEPLLDLVREYNTLSFLPMASKSYLILAKMELRMCGLLRLREVNAGNLHLTTN